MGCLFSCHQLLHTAAISALLAASSSITCTPCSVILVSAVVCPMPLKAQVWLCFYLWEVGRVFLDCELRVDLSLVEGELSKEDELP